MNADGTLNGNGNVQGYNMFAYCNNNPVMFSDPLGTGFLSSIKSFVNKTWSNIKNKIIRYKSSWKKFKSVDEAATASGAILNTLTQYDNLEHRQGDIYNSKTNTYGLTAIIDGFHNSVDFDPILQGDNSQELVALVHSHPYCNGHIPNEFSNVIENSDGTVYGDWVVVSNNKIDLYLAAPNGILYIMEWDVGEYNQRAVTTSLPEDNSMFNCR